MRSGNWVAHYKSDVDVNLENQRMIVMLPMVNTGEDHIGVNSYKTGTRDGKEIRNLY